MAGVLETAKELISVYFVVIGAYFATIYAILKTLANLLHNKSIFGLLAPPRSVPLPPAELNDPLYGKNSYVQIKGIKLHFVQKPGVGDASSKPLLLLLHGTPDFWYSFRRQISHFAEHYWVIAVDLRGSGDSEKPSGVFSAKYYKLEYFVEDIKNLIAIIGREKATIIGYQFGGTILYELILKYPEVVEKYVTLNAVPFYGIGFTSALAKFWFDFFSILPILPEIYLNQFNLYLVENTYKKDGGEAVVQSYKFAFSKPGTLTYSVNYHRANVVTLVTRLLFGLKIDQKNLPVGLALYGEKNILRTAKVFAHPEKVLPNLTVKPVKNGNDLIHQLQFETVNRVIDEFLDTTPSPTLTK